MNSPTRENSPYFFDLDLYERSTLSDCIAGAYRCAAAAADASFGIDVIDIAL